MCTPPTNQTIRDHARCGVIAHARRTANTLVQYAAGMAVVWRALTSCCCGGDEADDREALLAKDEEEDRPPPLTLPLLKESDDATTSAIIHEFKEDAVFRQFATAEMEGIIRRDQEDDDKLAAGILMAVQKGVVEPIPPVEPVNSINVLGKTADAVAGEIMQKLGDAPSRGCVPAGGKWWPAVP